MALIHYAMFKINPAAEKGEVFQLFRERYSRMELEIPQIKSIVLLQNCVERSSNCDILLKMELTDEAGLAAYLKHDLHLKLMDMTAGLADMICGLDYRPD